MGVMNVWQRAYWQPTAQLANDIAQLVSQTFNYLGIQLESFNPPDRESSFITSTPVK